MAGQFKAMKSEELVCPPEEAMRPTTPVELFFPRDWKYETVKYYLHGLTWTGLCNSYGQYKAWIFV